MRLVAPITLAIALAASPVAHAAADPAPTLLTDAQRDIERASIALFNDPEIRAAREAVMKAWSALPQYRSADGKAQLAGAVDEMAYFATRTAVAAAHPAPTVLWIETAPYRTGGLEVPGSRWGVDLPDRIYRLAPIDPSGRYVIKGKRHAQPSNDDFLFEASDLGVKALLPLPASDIDVAADGSFTITADATPAAGRRNHLTLPPASNSIMIRDTLADWDTQLPNAVSIERVDRPSPTGSADDTKRMALAFIDRCSRFNIELLQRTELQPVNQIKPFVRSGSDGVAGAIGSMAQFSLKNDEALVFTIDPQGGGYTSIQLTDPWLRSVPYWNATSSLSDRQVRKNTDGSMTFIIAPRDPGYYNWLSTGGLNDGAMTLRIERVTTSPDPAKVIRNAQIVKLTELAGTLPADTTRITPAERAAQLKARAAGYARRLVN